MPLFRRRNQSTLHRVPVNIVQLLNQFFLRKYVEIIRAGVPECRRESIIRQTRAPPCAAFSGNPLLQDLHNDRDISIVGLADEQMEMPRHDHVADHREFIFLPDLFKDPEEQVSVGR